jgi:hypothetical protein
VKRDFLAAVLIVSGAVALYALGGLAPAWGAKANRDASIWPLSMLALLAVLGIALALQSKRTPSREAGIGRPDWKRLCNMLVLLAYVPAVFVFGFYISALIYAFALPPLLGGAQWRHSAVFAVVFTMVLYAVFTVGLNMDLPRGRVMPSLDGPSARAMLPITASAEESRHARAT